MTLILLLLIYQTSYSKGDFEKLEGEWLVSTIINLKDSSITRGKHVPVDAYLRFVFKKGKLSFSTAPMDKGIEYPYEISPEGKINMFFVLPNSPHILIPVAKDVPEVEYQINYLSDEFLRLQTNDIYSNQIEYTFERLIKKAPSRRFEYKPILIHRIKYIDNLKNYLFEYTFLKSDKRHFNPTYLRGPALGSNAGVSIGSDLSWSVKYPKDFEIGVISEELIVMLTINTKGKVDYVKIIKSLDQTIDKSIVKYLYKTKWKPIVVDGIYVETEVVLHLKFLTEEKGSSVIKLE